MVIVMVIVIVIAIVIVIVVVAFFSVFFLTPKAYTECCEFLIAPLTSSPCFRVFCGGDGFGLEVFEATRTVQ